MDHPQILDHIRQAQTLTRKIFPSDLVFLLLNRNNYNISNNGMPVIINNTGEEIAVMNTGIWPIEDIIRYNSWEEDDILEQEIGSDYLMIAFLAGQGSLLVGATITNLNNVFVDLVDTTPHIVKIADNIFSFLKTNLIFVE